MAIVAGVCLPVINGETSMFTTEAIKAFTVVFNAGKGAGEAGNAPTRNPYKETTLEYRIWRDGWRNAYGYGSEFKELLAVEEGKVT